SWVALALGGFIASLARNGAPRRLAIFALVLGALATGTAGPIGSSVSWIFDRIPEAQIFREFYDLLFLAPLVVACGVASEVERVADWWRPALRRWRPVSIAAQVLVCAAAIVPAVLGGAASLVPFVAGLPQAPAIRGDDRILWLPATPPVGPPGFV